MGLPQIIIGSGPAGVACAKALLARGAQVILVDGGADLEEEKRSQLVTLRTSSSASWNAEGTSWMREGMQAKLEGIPNKLTYGSDFPFRTMPGAPRIQGTDVNTKFSLGKGGLSAVWGTSVLPFRQSDISDWPLTADDLAPHYRAVLDFMPVAQAHDGIEKLLPCFRASEPMPISPQAKALLDHMLRHQGELDAQGVIFGRSRLAINGTGIFRGFSSNAPGPCARCGLCMYGCPYELLYSAAQTVDEMRNDPNFQYLPGHVVQKVEERANEVLLSVVKSDWTKEILHASRIFIGAGVLATAALMLRSLQAYEQRLTFRDSHYFLLPMFRFRKTPHFVRGDLHTLAQLFVEVVDEELTTSTVHLQMYTYNDLFEQPITQKLGMLAKFFPSHQFLSRLYLFQGFLHSKDSPAMSAHLERTGDSDRLCIAAETKPDTDVLVRKLVKKLLKIRKSTSLIPLVPLMQRADPGRGFHTGGSFPMRRDPTGFETDLLGRTSKLKRVHIVDSSVLPSIAATTITFTTMANAHRIGSEADLGQ